MFVKLVVNQMSEICNAAHYRLSGAKEKDFFIINLLCKSQCFEGWYLRKGEIALPWGFRLVWGMAILP